MIVSIRFDNIQHFKIEKKDSFLIQTCSILYNYVFAHNEYTSDNLINLDTSFYSAYFLKEDVNVHALNWIQIDY